MRMTVESMLLKRERKWGFVGDICDCEGVCTSVAFNSLFLLYSTVPVLEYRVPTMVGLHDS